MKLSALFEAKRLSKIDAGYEWVLRNACVDAVQKDRDLEALWKLYNDGKVKGKKFFDENLQLIKDSLYWTRHHYDNLNITEDAIDYNGERIHLNITQHSGTPPMRLKGVDSVDLTFPSLAEFPEWLPEKCESISFSGCPNLTFKGAGTIVKDCKNIVIRYPVDLGFKGGFLSLFKIKNFEHFTYAQEKFDRRRRQFIELVYEPIKTGDVFACQEILQANGFREQAKA